MSPAEPASPAAQVTITDARAAQPEAQPESDTQPKDNASQPRRNPRRSIYRPWQAASKTSAAAKPKSSSAESEPSNRGPSAGGWLKMLDVTEPLRAAEPNEPADAKASTPATPAGANSPKPGSRSGWTAATTSTAGLPSLSEPPQPYSAVFNDTLKVSGLWDQLSLTVPPSEAAGAPGAGRPAAAQVSASAGAAPEAARSAAAPAARDASATDSSLAALWRPMTLSDNAQISANAPAASTDPARAGQRPESAQVSSLLLPFYLANTENDSRRSPDATSGSLIADDSPWDQGWSGPLRALMRPLALAENPVPPPSPGDRAQPVAYLQERLPEPDDLAIDSENEGDAATDATADGDKKDEDSIAEAKQLGSEPPDRSLEFLRSSTVLLKPGESQYDVGVTYLLSENDFPILISAGGVIVDVDEAQFKYRELAMPLEMRYGLLKRVQLFAGVPIGWSNTELTFAGLEAFENDGGLGDVYAGLTVQVVDVSECSPYVIATLGTTAPTGGDPFTGVVGLAPSAPSLGNGFWAVWGNLLFIQPYDPIVVFYGFGARYQFEHRYIGINFEPGTEYNYTFGVGFSVNEKVTLSTRFFGSYIEEIKADGVRIPGTILEPMSLRFAATIAKPCDRLVEPFVEFGITDDAISSYFGITWTF